MKGGLGMKWLRRIWNEWPEKYPYLPLWLNVIALIISVVVERNE